VRYCYPFWPQASYLRAMVTFTVYNPPKRDAASAFAPARAKPMAAGPDDDGDSEPEHVDNALAVSRFWQFRVPSQAPGPAGRGGILPTLLVTPTAEWWVPARTTSFPQIRWKRGACQWAA